MTKTQHNRLAQLKGSVKRIKSSLSSTCQQVWACPKVVALVPHKGLASSFDAAREIHEAVLACAAAIEMLEAICALPIDEPDAPEMDPYT